MVPNTVLGSTFFIENSVLVSTVRAINQYLLIYESIASVPYSKAWGENVVLHSTEKYVVNVLKIGQEFNQSVNQ